MPLQYQRQAMAPCLIRGAGIKTRAPDWPAPWPRWSRQPLSHSPVAHIRRGILDPMLEHFCGRCRSLLHEAASGATVPLQDMCGRCRTRLSATARRAVKGSVIPAALATFIVAGVGPPASPAAVRHGGGRVAAARGGGAGGRSPPLPPPRSWGRVWPLRHPPRLTDREQAGPPPVGTVAHEFPAGQAHPPMLVPLADLVPLQDRSESPHPAEPEPTMDGPASLYAATAATSPRATLVQPPSSGGAAPTT